MTMPKKNSSQRLGLLCLALMLSFLGACASRAPAPSFYVLKSEPPQAQPATAVAPAPPWQLVLPVRVPDYLDRDEVLLPQGAHAVQASQQQLWAESLTRSVPRVLMQDLRSLRGTGSLWTAPLAGVVVQGQLRVDLLALDVQPDARSVSLHARWSIHPLGTAASPAQPPVAHSLRLTVPSASPQVADLVGAHRLALWQWAQAIALSLPP
jgi:uncharacterized lipoprotein YmbA